MVVKKERISMSMCNTLGNLSLLSCINLIQDAVAQALGEVGCDNFTLRNKYNAMWVFIRNKVVLLGNLIWDEECQIESFISSFTKITVIVDILIKNKKGDMVLYSRLEACPLDYDTHKIRRNTSVGITEATPHQDSILNLVLPKQMEDKGNLIKNIVVESQNIDYSKHTNNAEYIRFILNTFSVLELENKKIGELDIQYIKESKEGDCLSIYKNDVEHRSSFQILREDEVITNIVLTYKE